MSTVSETSGPSKMRLSLLLSLVSAVLVAGAVACAGLTFWVVLRTSAIEERIALAHASYSEHQVLRSNLYQLFKEKADALLIGDRDRSALEAEVKGRIEANLVEIQRIIAREIEIDGEEELEELQLLSTLDRSIKDVMLRYERILEDLGGPNASGRQDLAVLLDRDIDRTLSDLIEVALAGEREEVNEALQEAAGFRQLVAVLAAAVLGAMIAITLAAIVIYRRTVVRPLADLVAGAGAYRRGSYDTPIPVAGAMEFRHLATTLSEMAAEIGARERDLRGEARQLESRVGERTAELQTILTRFEQVEASRRQMMADVSHELRTPLTIIQGEADIALRGGQVDPVAASESFSRIRDAARHSNRIVDDLLLVAREEAGQLRLDLRSVDLDAALADAASLAQSRVEVLRLGRPAPARVDPVRLRQCLLAVMNNALRYGGRNVTARVQRSADGFDILVEDDGPGMSDAEKDQAFDRFFRGSGAQSIGVDGTGLGLPIVRSIMAAHGGSVDLSDGESGGLVVRLRFAAALRSVQSPTEDIPARKAE
ncbi:sensor histidine kinase [Tabrizicola aquatica]|uniref:sensor histidine kinase n=1 Tax=Tabrizicola aquatica TaxID=909926 RepID=UPI000CD013ED|nr:sensor histidine kinase [Tabrizicola aquatica]